SINVARQTRFSPNLTTTWPQLREQYQIGPERYRPEVSGVVALMALNGPIVHSTNPQGRGPGWFQISSVHIDLRNVNILDRSRADIGEGHTAAEGYAVASRLATADTHPIPVDVHVVHDEGTSVIRARTTTVQGAPLPADWDVVLPESM